VRTELKGLAVVEAERVGHCLSMVAPGLPGCDQTVAYGLTVWQGQA
jgi:hypothetical protein